MGMGWKVLDSAPTSLRQGDRLVDAWKVYYKTDSGVVGSITIAKTDYNAHNVRQAIREEIASHDAVRNLSETGQ